MQTFVPGWDTQVTINAEDLTVVGNLLSFVRSRASQPKPVFGQKSQREIPGQGSGTIGVNGHVSAEKVASLEAIIEANASVTYQIIGGNATDSTEIGQWDGQMTVTELGMEAAADGEWDFVLSGTMDGWPTYTPVTP